MKVQAYRDLIGQFVHQFQSLKSAATPAERLAEFERLSRCRTELEGANCPRATPYDRKRATEWILEASRYVLEAPDLTIVGWMTR